MSLLSDLWHSLTRPKLGRIALPDNRDAAYPMSLALGEAPVGAIGAIWAINGAALDQKSTQHCVGFAWAAFLRTTPTYTPLTRTLNGHTVYFGAKKYDGLPGGIEGSTVRGGVKALKADGRIASYLWSTNKAMLDQGLLTRGPVVVGTNWTTGMFKADRSSFVYPHGKVVGGHAYLLYGVDTRLDQYYCLNSWGSGFGILGTFKMRGQDLWELI